MENEKMPTIEVHNKPEQYDLSDYSNRLKSKDFFPKAFLIPTQVQLDKQKGLVVIKRNQGALDKYQREEVKDIIIDEQLKIQHDNSSDNTKNLEHGLLSLFKKSNNRKIRLAICVCVYSQPKHMLKATIKGIQQSYKHFFERAGIRSHEIILIVIFDGIEKVNASKDQTENMISYFNEFDFKNGFRHKPYSLTVQQLLEQYKKQIENNNNQFESFDNQDYEDIQNYNDISVFTEAELQQLKCKLFETQYNQYTRIKKLLQNIREVKNNKDIKVDHLPRDVAQKYEQLCINYVVQKNIQIENDVQQYFSNKKQLRTTFIYQALRETELQCISYLESRKDKSILYPARLETGQQIKYSNRKDDEKKSKKKDYHYMFLCVKHTNAGKLSSHLLYFEGFCKIIDPEFCILLDVGLKPKNDAIYKMWAYMEKNRKCGGVCGYMGLKIQNPADDLGYREDGFDLSELDFLTKCADLFVDLQRCQQFEYHFAHMLDKPFQSAFDYIHVLPGAFSGYRWKALQSINYQTKIEEFQRKQRQNNNQQGKIESQTYRTALQFKSQKSQAQNESKNLLDQKAQQETIMQKYLKTALSHDLNLSLEDSNMYLAEDRIMCLGIHALGYDLAYLPDAQSTVDPVTSLTRMLGQRRRWINGSWFAFEYVFKHRNQRTTFRFFLQLIYYYFVEYITYISIGLFYVTMNLTVTTVAKQYLVPAIERFFLAHEQYELQHYTFLIFDVESMAESIPHIINFVYLIIIGGIVFLSLNLNQNNSRFSRLYYLASSILGFYGIIVFVLLGYNIYTIIMGITSGGIIDTFIIPTIYLKALILFIVAGHAIPIIWTFSLRKYSEMLSSVLSYIFFVPTYIHILIIYSFCRIDDLSWGTKGLDEDVQRGKTIEWKKQKYIFVCKFLFTNIIFSYILMEVMKYQIVKNVIILAFTVLVAFLLVFRLFFAAFYLLKYKLKSYSLKFSDDVINQNLDRGQKISIKLKNIERYIQSISQKTTIPKKLKQYKESSEIFQKINHSRLTLKHRSRIARQIIDNNVLPLEEIKRKKMRNKGKILLKKKLQVIQQVSHEQSNCTLKSKRSEKMSSNSQLKNLNQQEQIPIKQKSSLPKVPKLKVRFEEPLLKIEEESEPQAVTQIKTDSGQKQSKQEQQKQHKTNIQSQLLSKMQKYKNKIKRKQT